MAPLPESTRKVSKSSRKGKSSRKYGLVSGVKCYREVRCDKDRKSHCTFIDFCFMASVEE